MGQTGPGASRTAHDRAPRRRARAPEGPARRTTKPATASPRIEELVVAAHGAGPAPPARENGAVLARALRYERGKSARRLSNVASERAVSPPGNGKLAGLADGGGQRSCHACLARPGTKPQRASQ